MQSQVVEAPGSAYKSTSVARLNTNTMWAYRIALCVLVLGSLGLRLFGIGWGIPNFDPSRVAASAYRNSYHIDEDNFIWGLMQMRPAEGNFDVLDYHWGTLQFYLIYGTLLGGEVTGILPSPWETAFREGDIATLPKIYILGRLLSVAAGVIGTLIVVALGTLLAGRAAGLAAGVAYAVTPLAVTEAHYLTNDVVMSVFVAGSVLCAALAVKVAEPPRAGLRWLVVAGFLLGLGVSDKYSAVFAAPALVIAQLLVWRTHPRGQGRQRTASLFAFPWLAVIIGFLIGEPYALIMPGKVIDGLQLTTEGNAADLSSGLRQIGGMLVWQARNVAALALTWPLALLAVGGLGLIAWSVGRALRSAQTKNDASPRDEGRWTMDEGGLVRPSSFVHRPSSIVLRPSSLALPLPIAGPSLVMLVAIASLGASLALNKVFVIRYSQPLLPLLAVAAGVAWAAIPLAWLRWGAGAIALAVASIITLGQLSIMSGPHPANDLLAWLQSHFQPGQTVAQIWPEYPPLDGGSYMLIRIDPWNPQLPAGARPDYIIMDNMAFAPPSPALAGLLAHDYHEVARFSVQPHMGPFAWDEGVTPHDWKYSHPTFTVYAPTRNEK
jgi:hypothetical protein